MTRTIVEMVQKKLDICMQNMPCPKKDLENEHMCQLLAKVLQCKDTLTWTREQRRRRSSKEWTQQQQWHSKEQRRMNSEDCHGKMLVKLLKMKTSKQTNCVRLFCIPAMRLGGSPRIGCQGVVEFPMVVHGGEGLVGLGVCDTSGI